MLIIGLKRVSKSVRYFVKVTGNSSRPPGIPVPEFPEISGNKPLLNS